MKVSLEKIYVAQQSLSKILSQDLPSTIAFRLSRLAKQVKIELDTFEENRVKLVKKYSAGPKEGKKSTDKETGDEQTLRVHPSKMNEFSQELTEMLAVEVNLDFKPIRLEDLEDAKISAIDIVNLEPFISE